MWGRLFGSVDGSAHLQGRMRDKIVKAVNDGLLLPGAPLPSTRELAELLGVSRVTVSLAMQQLCDSGLVVARERSGHHVHPNSLRERAQARPEAASRPSSGGPAWAERIATRPSSQRNITKPADWQRMPFPFIYGQFDAKLFPLAHWRECAMESMHVAAIGQWAPDHIDRDHEPLIEQIQQRLLPARGIFARRDEILVTAGAQQAMYLLAQLLVQPRTPVGIEDPGYPDARNNLLLRTASVRPLPVDDEGLVVGPELARCRYVYVTPSHQCPTTATMSLPRRQALLERAERHDIVIIEDDHESELNYAGKPSPALKSLDTTGRVIYLGSLSKTLAHGLRIGYVVAPAELIREARALRRLMLRHPPTNNEHTAALFIEHGFHASFVRKLNLTYRERAEALMSALRRHLPEAEARQAHGGSALWVRLPCVDDTRRLAAKALEAGVVIEPGDVFFGSTPAPRNFVRMGYSSIAADDIDAGIKLLARSVRARG
jgi:GntR family transcriptional regulator/MocR family aminotransferase